MISVCMATYNGEKFIEEQLLSILKQLGEDDEVIVSDDSSTDRTLDIISGIGDHRVRIFGGCSFHSPKLNFENALKHSKGDHIYLSDQDDIWEDRKISVTEDYLTDNDLVVSDATIIDADGNVLRDSFFRLMNSGRGYLKNLCNNTYMGCCMAFDRRLLEICLPFPRSIPMHDSYIGLMAELCGSPVFIPDKLVRHRRHGGNASTTGERSTSTTWEKLRNRYWLLSATLSRTHGKNII